MARTNRVIDASVDEVESAKLSAVALMKDSVPNNTIDLFYEADLARVENGIRKLNEYSSKAWLLSAILLYTLVYDKQLYKESGLDWSDYSKAARERIGLDQRDVSDQLSSARFFIKNREELERQGFDPAGSYRKLSRAETATEACGDVHETIRHLAKDTWREFSDWYYSFKGKTKLLKSENPRNDIKIKNGKFYINDTEAVKVSDAIPEHDKKRIEKYIADIFEALKDGYEPAIVPVYDESEAKVLPKLRDKYRQGK